MSEASSIFRSIDTNGNNCINLEEFEAFWKVCEHDPLV